MKPIRAGKLQTTGKRALLFMLAAALTLALFGGCGQNAVGESGIEVGNSNIVSSSQVNSSTVVPNEVIDRLLNQYIIPYEYFSDGQNWDFSNEDYLPKDSTPSFNATPNLDNLVVKFSLGVLAHNTPQALSKQFASIADDTGVGYRITKDLQKAVGAFYFGATVNNPIESSFAPDQYPNGLPSYIVPSERHLSFKSAKVLENGDIRMVIDRYAPDSDTPVSSCAYIFRPFTVDVPPDSLLSELFKKGDSAYRFVSVLDQPIHYPDNEVHIQSAEELIALSKAVNSGDTAYQNNRYYLDADIDMSGFTIEPIGQYARDPDAEIGTYGFGTYFDGQGHTIRNLSMQVTADDPEKGYNVGLFSVIASVGTVTNLNLENCSVALTVPIHLTAGQSCGGLAGQCYGTITDCRVSGTVTGDYQVGGLVGLAAWLSKISECGVNVSVTGEAEIGAFAGSMNNCTISRCTAEGEVTAVSGTAYERPRGIGGFSGFNVIGSIDNCQSSVFVKTTVPSEWVGGFIGYNQGIVTNSRYDIDKTASWDAVDVEYGNNSYADVAGVSRSELDMLG